MGLCESTFPYWLGEVLLLRPTGMFALGFNSLGRTHHLWKLNGNEVDDLGEALLDFTTYADVEACLADHST